MKISAEIVADSRNSQGDRITTIKVTFPRFILAELNTHRMFSRNSASSRAIPFDKMLESVEKNPFIPIAWQKDHKGMQGTEYFTTEELEKSKDVNGQDMMIRNWLDSRDKAIQTAKTLSALGLTKQLCNRILEPFMWHTVLITATEWENFFNLRSPSYFGEYRSWKDVKKSLDGNLQDLGTRHELDLIYRLQVNSAQAEINMMAMTESTPKELSPGEWHIPFGDNINPGIVKYAEEHSENGTKQVEYPSGKILREGFEPSDSVNFYKVKIATARCARVSYTVVGEEGKPADYEKDIQLHDRLLESGHFSPFEHCAKAMTEKEYHQYVNGKAMTLGNIFDIEKSHGWCLNFKGFIQYRALI